jgi:Ca-activated chloride channel family protein
MGLSVDAGPARAGARTLDVSLELRTASGGYDDLASPLVTVRSGAGERRDVFMKQRAPGLYAASAIVDADQPATVTVDGAHDATGAMRVVAVDPSAEYRWGAPDEPLLRTIAASTGGAWTPTPADILKPVASTPATHRPLWPWCVGIALALWLLDIWLRRVRLFERAVQAA